MRIIKSKSLLLRSIFVLTLLFGINTFICRINYASEKPQPKNKYKIIRPVYLMAVYNNKKEKQINKKTAQAYLHDERYADRTFVAFQCEVPAGAVMTIVGSAPKVWPLFFLPNRYFIQLDPDYSRGLDIIIELNRGIEGSLDGMNPEIFTRLE